MSLDDWKKLPRRRLDADDLDGSDRVSKCIAYALKNGVSLEILYAAPDDLTRRTVWPKRVERVKTNQYGAAYMRAYCELRGEDRTFRLDRIREARVPDGPTELNGASEATRVQKSPPVVVEFPRTAPLATERRQPKRSPLEDPLATPPPKKSPPTRKPVPPTRKTTPPTRREQPARAPVASTASSGCLLPIALAGVAVAALAMLTAALT